ncbi:MAG: DUF4292 domain-containing protein [Bacteroidales bacterium]|nr:DUF4292 domain-containing protein [Bacteroidales bacterium]
MRTASKIILPMLMAAVLLLVGCTAPKGFVKESRVEGATVAALSALPSLNRNVACLSANVRMTATVDGESATAKGKLRLKRGEGAQISATAMGLMEAACFEFLPYAVRFIYKIDKIYADAPYSGVPFLQQTGTGYDILEALLLNAVFSPDGRPVREALTGMASVDSGEYITLITSRQYPNVYRFTIEKRTGNLVRCEGDYANGGTLVCRYSDFAALDGVAFPSVIELQFRGEDCVASLLFKMSGLKSSEFKFSPRRVNDAYSRASLEAILNGVGNSAE